MAECAMPDQPYQRVMHRMAERTHRRRIHAAATALTLFGLLATAPGWAQFTPFEAAIAEFDAEVAAGVAEDAAGCVSVAVFVADEVIWAKGYGWADIENTVACTAETAHSCCVATSINCSAQRRSESLTYRWSPTRWRNGSSPTNWRARRIASP